MTKKYKSELFASIHQLATGLCEEGLIDMNALREYDQTCLVPDEELTPDEIRRIREEAHMSRSIFAGYLSVSARLLADWEKGLKKPHGPALRLLSIVKHKGIEAIAL